MLQNNLNPLKKNCPKRPFEQLCTIKQFLSITPCSNNFFFFFSLIFLIFKASALWANAFLESRCLSVCPLSHEAFFEASHWPKGHMISSRPLIGQPSFTIKLRWVSFFFCPKALWRQRRRQRRGGVNKKMLKSFLVAALLSALVERFFVSCMRDFLSEHIS